MKKPPTVARSRRRAKFFTACLSRGWNYDTGAGSAVASSPAAGSAIAGSGARTPDRGPHPRRDLGPEQLDRAHHVRVLDGADAHLADVALVPEQLVLEQDLLGHLLDRAGGERAARRAQRLVLRRGPDGGHPRSRPIRFIISRYGGANAASASLRGRADERVRVDRDARLAGSWPAAA